MTEPESAKKRTRRAEPINKHTAKNGTVTYWFQVDVGTKSDGTRNRQQFTYATQREARREYRRITNEVAEGRYVARTKATVGEHIKSWLDGRRDVRRVTVEGYRNALKPVVDRLGNLPLQQLTKQHVDELVNWRLTEGRGGRRPMSETASAVLAFVRQYPTGIRYAAVIEQFGERGGRHLGRLVASGHLVRAERGVYAVATAEHAPGRVAQGVSERTVTTMLVQLSAALDDAVAQGLVTRNVARLVKRPDVIDKEMHVWTYEQSRQFREYVRGHRLYALFLLSLCGLRRSEVMGLEWGAVDFDKGTVEVRQGRVAVTATETETGDPKSRRSRRTLPAPPDVLDALRRLRTVQGAEKLAVGEHYPTDHNFVARLEDGTPIRHEWYGDEFQRQAKAAGVPVIRLHDTRHTAATMLLDSGASPATAAKWLGHDPAVLLRVYAHTYDETLAAAGETLLGAATGT